MAPLKLVAFLHQTKAEHFPKIRMYVHHQHQSITFPEEKYITYTYSRFVRERERENEYFLNVSFIFSGTEIQTFKKLIFGLLFATIYVKSQFSWFLKVSGSMYAYHTNNNNCYVDSNLKRTKDCEIYNLLTSLSILLLKIKHKLKEMRRSAVCM